MKKHRHMQDCSGSWSNSGEAGLDEYTYQQYMMVMEMGDHQSEQEPSSANGKDFNSTNHDKYVPVGHCVALQVIN